MGGKQNLLQVGKMTFFKLKINKWISGQPTCEFTVITPRIFEGLCV